MWVRVVDLVGHRTLGVGVACPLVVAWDDRHRLGEVAGGREGVGRRVVGRRIAWAGRGVRPWKDGSLEVGLVLGRMRRLVGRLLEEEG